MNEAKSYNLRNAAKPFKDGAYRLIIAVLARGYEQHTHSFYTGYAQTYPQKNEMGGGIPDSCERQAALCVRLPDAQVRMPDVRERQPDARERRPDFRVQAESLESLIGGRLSDLSTPLNPIYLTPPSKPFVITLLLQPWLEPQNGVSAYCQAGGCLWESN